MQWRVTLEVIDPTGDKYQGEFSFDKDIGRLQDGELGCSLEDGKTVMAEIQRIVVQREIDLYLEFRRICLDCQSRRWVKDRRIRKIETVFGIVEVESPRYRAGKRISTTCAEAGVNAVVAKRFVKKQQMRWAPHSADSLLAVRAAVPNNELKGRMKYVPPSRKSRDVNAGGYQPNLPLAFAP